MRVTILRGISGAGKTTWVKDHVADAVVVSADHHFTIDGEYKFDRSKLQENHNKCFKKFLEAILKSELWIIVDNTNIETWEYAPYVLAARAYDYEVELITFICSVELSQSRKDLVPTEQLQNMQKRLDEETEYMPQRFRSIHRVINIC
ncbi:MAG: hypothetical protein A2V81_02940 [Candidatus Abawacabacteria bacterium RBG_16_42_10]|uniref:AAA family ATPase n=1 Tax=Candidatus Abawacabacteria bacterium RBG_16_42_10 TaxID=1817814 RepID=A0A1F4XK48_9BACT|nr:MAG: hypothetical protein A2V81_02940 [Candidatus Abawacabacteria bacterium RBG_16_42_10]